MPPHEEHDETEQEVLSPIADMLDSQTLAVIQKSEIDTQIATAKKYPRSLVKFTNTATALATQDEECASECVYALPRDGKFIEGPSARLAEIIAYSWGNCRAGARIISEDEEFVTAQGQFIDLEANVQISYEVRRRITTKAGKRYNSDMISTTANAACSIALRNAVLKGVPKAVWRKVYDKARATIAGNEKTLDTRRTAAIKQFQLMGAKPEQIFTLLEIKGIEDITLEHLVTLRGIYNAIRENETTVERAFAPEPSQDLKLAEKSRENLEKIKEKYAQQPLTVTEVDPAYADKLREEAERQLKAVAEKFGAQPSIPATAGAGMETPAAPKQEEGALGSPIPPAGPEVAPAPSGPPPEDEAHGLPLAFEEPKKNPRKR